MAKAVFESTPGNPTGPTTTSETGVRDFDRIKAAGDDKFSVQDQDGGTSRVVNRSGNKYTVYKRLGNTEGWPRGHTPEQMQEVHQAEQLKQISIDSNSTMENGRKHPEHERNIVRENIARSKFNPTELDSSRGTLDIHAIGSASGLSNSGETNSIAFYRPSEHSVYMGAEHLNNNVLIHEIGHAVDRNDVASQNKKSNLLWHVKDDRKFFGFGPKNDYAKHYSDVDNGYREGYAEKFATDNWVPDPRDDKRGGTEEQQSLYKARGYIGSATSSKSRVAAFAKGYLHADGPPATSSFMQNTIDELENSVKDSSFSDMSEGKVDEVIPAVLSKYKDDPKYNTLGTIKKAHKKNLAKEAKNS